MSSLLAYIKNGSRGRFRPTIRPLSLLDTSVWAFKGDVCAYTIITVKTLLCGHSKRRPKIGFQDRLLLNAGQKYCRMLQGEHSAIVSTFVKLPFAIKTLFCLFLSGGLRQDLLYRNLVYWLK